MEDSSYWFKHRARVFLEILGHYPPPGALFDIGGGNGYMVKAFRESGHEAVLIEPGMDGCLAAMQRGLTPVLNGTIESLGISEEILPAIGLFDVVEHIENDVEFLRRVFGLLAPDGFLYLTVPAFQSLWSENDGSAGHFRRYSRNQIERVVEVAGGELVFSTYLFEVLVIPLFVARSIPFRLGIGPTKANSTETHSVPGGFAGKLLEMSLDHELRTIESGRRVRVGTSVALVARRIL